jgi:hypothetical protein
VHVSVISLDSMLVSVAEPQIRAISNGKFSKYVFPDFFLAAISDDFAEAATNKACVLTMDAQIFFMSTGTGVSVRIW